MPTINIHAHCSDHEAVQALYEALSLNTTWFSFSAHSDDPGASDEDLTPPSGISREHMEAAIIIHVNEMVAWVRQHVTDGPLTEVSGMTLYQAFRRLFDDEQADLGDLTATAVQAQCIRGAFKDAQGGMVPL